MKCYCVAIWCPLSDNCGRSKEQTSTDTNSYVNYSGDVMANSRGYTCKWFTPKKDK